MKLLHGKPPQPLASGVILLLLLSCCLLQESDAGAALLVLGAMVPLTYGIYSKLVEFYATKVIKRMTIQVPAPYDMEVTEEYCQESVPTIATLRKTISKVTNLVERPRDRQVWNLWAACAMSKKFPNTSLSYPTNNTTNMIDYDNTTTTWIKSLVGNYSFAYRSYVNIEEKTAICASFKTFHLFTSPFVNRGKTELKIFVDNNSQDNNDGGHLLMAVTAQDTFWGKGFLPMTITWFGHVVMPADGDGDGDGDGQRLRIDWTRTQMIKGRKQQQTIIQNPGPAEKLRKIPWEILTKEDGMILVQRGDVGVLAFDTTVQ